MKKLLFIIMVILFASLVLVGCSDSLSGNEQETANNFNYDQLLEMPIEYVGESDRIVFESWDQHKEYILSRGVDRAAVAAIECIEFAATVNILRLRAKLFQGVRLLLLGKNSTIAILKTVQSWRSPKIIIYIQGITKLKLKCLNLSERILKRT